MVNIPEHLRAHLTDSAGQPWEGRTFSDNPWSEDDGSAPAELLAALQQFRGGTVPLPSVIDALRASRLLIPLVAHLGEAGTNEAGQTVDKSAELSIVSVQAPDGRAALPVFSSVDAMRAWNPDARPVPIDARKAALAAASENTQLMILDPANETELVIRRPAMWAIAQDTEYTVSWQHPYVQQVCSKLMAAHPELGSIDLNPGDLDGRFSGPELLVTLGVDRSVDDSVCNALLADTRANFAADSELVTVVDSVAISVARHEPAADASKRTPQDAVPPKAGLLGWLRRR